MENGNSSGSGQEKDFLVYQGNSVPRLIRFAWTMIVIFSIYYLIAYAWPDLVEWMKKIK